MGSLMARRAVILNSSRMLLPPEYQRVEYLQCMARNSRIDTGVNGNDDSLIFDFVYMPLSILAYYGHFGNYDGESKRCWRLIQSGASTPTLFVFSAQSRRAGASGSLKVVRDGDSILNHKFRIRLSYGYMHSQCDDGFWASNTITNDDYEPSTKNICIGSISTIHTGAGSDGRFYGDFRIRQGGTLIRNYVPCYRKSDSKAGFYDTVNGTFNPSIGTEDFIAGND